MGIIVAVGACFCCVLMTALFIICCYFANARERATKNAKSDSARSGEGSEGKKPPTTLPSSPPTLTVAPREGNMTIPMTDLASMMKREISAASAKSWNSEDLYKDENKVTPSSLAIEKSDESLYRPHGAPTTSKGSPEDRARRQKNGFIE